MSTAGLFTVVTDEFVTAIRLAAARAGSIMALAKEMGINDRRIRMVICQRLVSEDWVDRFCATGLTELWLTDLEWGTWSEMMDKLDPEGAWRDRRRAAQQEAVESRARNRERERVPEKRRPKRVKDPDWDMSYTRRWKRERGIHESSDDGAEAVADAGDTARGSGEGLQPWAPGDGPRSADSDQDPA